MTDFQERVSSLRRVALAKSKCSKGRGTSVLLARDAREKFVPRCTQRSRQLVKGAGGRVTNTPKERVNTGNLAEHLLDDNGRITQADNLARSPRLVHGSVPKVAIEVKVGKERGLHQVVGGLVRNARGGLRSTTGVSLGRRVPGTKEKEFSFDEGGKGMSPERAIRSLGSPVREETIELTLPPRELSRPMMSPSRQVPRVPVVSHFLKAQPPGQAAELQDTVLSRIARKASEVASPTVDSTQDPDSKGINAEVR